MGNLEVCPVGDGVVVKPRGSIARVAGPVRHFCVVFDVDNFYTEFVIML
jgi:hypothetical protein